MGTRPTSEEMAEALHLYRLGDLDGAAARCRAIVARDAGCGAAWDRLARIAERQGLLDEAEADYRRAIDALARPAEAHNNLAVLLQRRGDSDGALAHYQRAAALGLEHALLYSNLGCLLRDRGQLQDSADQLTRALAIDPSLAHAHSNLGVTLALQGAIARALPHLRRALALQPDWDVAHSNLLFCLNYADDLSPIEIAASHFAFGRRHAGAPARAAAAEGDADPERPLRVGLVSPDLKRHSVAHFLAPILDGYDRDDLSITCYADVARPDEVSDRLRAAADRWRSIPGLPDADVARLVRADRIDVLIDLAGHTAGNRLSLFATRIAPVQMTYLGYPNTTGLDTVDWRITDAWADPPGLTEALHSEELLRIAGGFLCFRPHPDSPTPTPPPARARGRITFGSFNLPAKISSTTLGLWAAILRQVPGARLCLKGPAFADAATRAAFEQRLASSPLAGLEVELWGHLPDERDHLAAYGRIDIALDTFPYGGTTTTCEALWMGVPVVTLAGRSHAARVGVSLLSRLRQSALIADSPAAYVAAAVGLAGDLDRLAGLRSSLRGRMVASGLTDAHGFARAFAEALRRAWRFHCRRAGAGAAGLTLAAALEDQDEDEDGFVHAALARGERAIDIGAASHGGHALSMGRRVGFGGQVWAFAPAHAGADRLRKSVTTGGLPQVTVIAAALGAVDPLTLDGYRARLGLVDIALVAIDAAGAEAAIIDGGIRFFTEESPLVMWQERPGTALDRGLVARFERLGYQIFRLIPGLGILAPPGERAAPDLLGSSRFACKGDRAERLERLGLLARASAPTDSSDAVSPPPGAGLVYLRAQLFAAALWPRWAAGIAGAGDYERALDHYALARDPTQSPGVRHAALARAFAIVDACARAQPATSLPVLQTWARVAIEYGARATAIEALNRIVARAATASDGDLDRPFLAVGPRFDHLPPHEADGAGALLRWVTDAALEQRERLHAGTGS
jgi:protein O-GlcNAc transferase